MSDRKFNIVVTIMHSSLKIQRDWRHSLEIERKFGFTIRTPRSRIWMGRDK